MSERLVDEEEVNAICVVSVYVLQTGGFGQEPASGKAAENNDRILAPPGKLETLATLIVNGDVGKSLPCVNARLMQQTGIAPHGRLSLDRRVLVHAGRDIGGADSRHENRNSA